jgi:MFS family permease
VRALLAHRDARFYLAGQALSTVGDNALWLAMGIWVKILTGSSSAAGLVFFAFTCGILLAPVTGLVADRLRRRPLLIGANLGAAAGVCCLLLVQGRGQVWLICLHRAPAFLGVLEAVMGAGALAGGALAAPVMRRTGERALAALALAVAAAACLLLIPPSLPVVLAAMGLLGLSIVWVNVGAITLIQRRTPASLLGRVDAALTMSITVPQTVSIALGAALVAVVDYRLLLAMMTVVIVIAAAYLAGEPRARKSPESDAMPPASDGQSRVPVGNIG